MTKPTKINFSGMSALVADANAAFLTIIAGMLYEFGVSNITRATTGEQALHQFSVQQIDFAFLDCFLPGINGFDICQRVRATPGPNQMVPILILTSHAQRDNVVRARDVGASMVMIKPISGSMLFDRLAWAAENARDFIMCANYNGPDRRYKNESFSGIGRRETDKGKGGEQRGSSMSQAEIDKLSTSFS